MKIDCCSLFSQMHQEHQIKHQTLLIYVRFYFSDTTLTLLALAVSAKTVEHKLHVLKHTRLQDKIPKECLKVFTTIKITKTRTFGCLRRTQMAVSILDAGKSCLCSITPFCNQQLQIQFAAK